MLSPARNGTLPLGGSLPAAADKRRSSMIEMVALAALCIVGVLVLLPSTDEKVAALIAGQRYTQAIALLEAKGGTAPFNAYEAFSLARLYRDVGEDAKAIALLEPMLAADPVASSVLHELAALYRAANRPRDEIRILEQLLRQGPDAAASERLAAIYREFAETPVNGQEHRAEPSSALTDAAPAKPTEPASNSQTRNSILSEETTR